MSRGLGIVFLVVVALGAACDESGRRGSFVVELYDGEVWCDADQGLCRDGNNEPAEPVDRLYGAAFVGHLASSDGAGTYVYVEAARTNAVVGVLEMDLPNAGSPRISYREIPKGGGLTFFEADSVVGHVELPARNCPCDDGRFELQLTDFGPDEIAGTSDDEVRRLSRGQFSRSGNYCRSSLLTSVAGIKATRVIHLGCSAKRAFSGTYPSQPRYHDDTEVEVGCGVEDDAYDDEADEGGCGGDEGYEEDEEDGSGCEGDDADSWNSGGDSSGGCEGDGGGDGDGYDSSGGGCEGDDSDAGGCDDEAQAASIKACRRKQPQQRRLRPLGTLPYVLIALLITHLRRRRRRRLSSSGSSRGQTCSSIISEG